MGHHHPAADAAGGLSQRVSNPRFSGPMTRRTHSFKRNTNTNNNNSNSSSSSQNQNSSHSHEVIDLHIGSPRSKIPDGPESMRPAHVSSVSHRVYLRRKISSLTVDFADFRLELKGRRKLGQWMFFMFCGVCLFMSLFKICATGWFGSAIDSLGSNQEEGSHPFGYMDNGDNIHRRTDIEVERTITVVASDTVDTHASVAHHSEICSNPNSENFTECLIC